MHIFHIAHEADWAKAVAAGSYRVDSLDTEGFIHLSTRLQVLDTAERYYRGVRGLLLLEIDEARLDPALLRYEESTGGALFPHHYGPLPGAAIVSAHIFAPRDDGGFDWPDALA